MKRDKTKTPTPTPLKQKNTLINLNENFSLIISNVLSIFALFLFLYFYSIIREIKKKDMKEISNIPDHEELVCQKKFEINNCSYALENPENSAPLLIKICNRFNECRQKKNKKTVTLSKLIFAHFGSLVQAFVEELESSTILFIFGVLGVSILIKALKNRPKIIA